MVAAGTGSTESGIGLLGRDKGGAIIAGPREVAKAEVQAGRRWLARVLANDAPAPVLALQHEHLGGDVTV